MVREGHFSKVHAMKPPCLSRPAVVDYLQREFARPQSNKVLHAHPSPMYWQPHDGDTQARWAQRQRVSARRPIADNLYLGLPFCLPTEPAHCGFCLFPTTDYTGKRQVQIYLDWLEREAALYGDLLANDVLASVYVGGGTPNLMRDDDYARVLKVAEGLYGTLPAGIEKTLEGIPQLFTPDKIAAIAGAGFNRVSMGVQQMSDKLIHYSGRKQTHKQVVEAIAGFHQAGLACNVDLIYGWPEQTMDDMLQDLGELVALGVRHITHYQLNIAGRSAFSKSLRGVLPPLALVLEMYRESVRFLRAHGFEQVTVYDWARVQSDGHLFNWAGADGYQYESLLRDAFHVAQEGVDETRNMVGLGYAAISFPMTWPEKDGPNWCQMNARTLDGYYGAIARGAFPVDRQYRHGPVDIQLTWLFQSMQAMAIDAHAYAVIFESDLLTDFAPIWEELAHRQWIEIDDKGVRFVDVGAFHIPMLQALLSEARLQEIRKESTAQREFDNVIPIVPA